MLSDADLASIVAKTYTLLPSVHFDPDTRAMFSVHGGEWVCGIPGTVDFPGWVRDFSAWPDWFSMIGPCHAGFGTGGKALWALVRPKLPKDKRIIFTGHSLGGAYAQVLAAMYGAENRNPCEVVTFGSPRVRIAFNLGFRSLLHRSMRVELYARVGDPIPDVPFKPLYLHAARLIPIGKPVDSIDPMANHDIALYASDLKAVGL